MNKKQYKELLKPYFEDIEPEKVGIEFDRVEDVLKELEEEIYTKINRKYYYCEECKKYYYKKDWGTEDTKEIRYGDIVYIDAGYGDDDEVADVTYHVKYRICPIHKDHKIVVSRVPISSTNRRKAR